MEPNITPDGFTQSITVVLSDITEQVTAARPLPSLISSRESTLFSKTPTG
jgi:hypothetical protein